MMNDVPVREHCSRYATRSTLSTAWSHELDSLSRPNTGIAQASRRVLMSETHASHRVAHIDDMPHEEGSSPGTEWKPVRRVFDISSFGTALARATEAGDTLTHDHDEVGTRHEELFLIVSGHATYRVDGEEIDAPAGTFLYVPDPATVRGVVALEAGTTMFVIGGEPGAYTPSDWDTAPLPE
jgi:mannose-6-phosphate isomerase-like protein (cupin superfamily)